jgi:glycosyltransferase involved in cell wall biosynthesis
VAPNGVDAPEPPLWTGGAGGYLLWLGRYDPEHKGLDLLVRALALLDPAERPRLRLHGSDWRGGKAVLERLVTELGLAPWVAIGAGVYGAEKRGILIAADGFIYPSRWEGFGDSVLEAVSLGMPALCTPYPLGMHLARRGGAILAEATPEALKSGLEVFGDRARAAAIGTTGAEIARTDFAWPAVATSWLEQVAAIVPARRR